MRLNPLSGFLNAATAGTGGSSLARAVSAAAKPGSDSRPLRAHQDRGGVSDKWDEDCGVRKGEKRRGSLWLFERAQIRFVMVRWRGR